MLQVPTQSHIILGSVDNDHTGEGLREGGVKIEADFGALFDSIGYSRAALSRFAGIDTTGATPSNAGIQTAFNFCAANGIELFWDCPAYISCAVNFNGAVFVPSFLKVRFTGTGVLICDSMLSPVLVMANAHDWRFENFTLSYITNGTTGAFGDFAMTTSGPNAGIFNDQALKNYLIANCGNTFGAGGSAIWGGPPPGGGLIMITGNSYRGYFTGKGRISVADAALPSQYIPVFCCLTTQWNVGLTNITGSTIPSNLNASIPSEIYFKGLEIDGYWMGWVGGANAVFFEDIVAKRYSDMQDSSAGTIGGPSAIFAPPHLFYLQSGTTLPCRAMYANITDQGIYTGGNRRSSGSGYINSIKFEPGSGSSIRGYRSYRPHGFADFLGHGFALGEATGIHVEMDTSAGTSVSVSANAAMLLGATSCTILTTGGWAWAGGSFQATFSNGDVRTITAVANNPSINWTGGLSSACTPAFTVAAVVGPNFALRNPSSSSMTDVTVDMDVIDTATVPAVFPIFSDNGIGHTNVHFNCRVMQNDYPGAYQPGFVICGSGNIVKIKYILGACTSTSPSNGALRIQGGASMNNCYHEMEVVGWRLFNSTNLESLKHRFGLQAGTGGLLVSAGNRGRVLDVTNGWELIWDNGLARESWTQRQIITPGAGASATSSIAFPTGFAAEAAWSTQTSFVGPTSIGVGWSGSPNALLTAQAATTGVFQPSPGGFLVSMGTGQTVLVTANGANFTGTGQAILVVRGVRNYVGS